MNALAISLPVTGAQHHKVTDSHLAREAYL